MPYRDEDVALGDPPSALQVGTELELEQIFDFKELFGWEAKNRYNVKSTDGHELLIAEIEDPEASCNQCHRQACKANREWNLRVFNGTTEESEVLRMHKNQECCIEVCGREPTPCCGDRTLTVTNPDGYVVGSATQPQLSIFQCCSLGIQVNVGDEHKYDINGSLLQCGRFCPMCFDKEFEITYADDTEREQGTLGHVIRPAITCGEMCKKTNRIHIDFPEDSDQRDRAALMGGAMLYEIYEEMKQQQNDNNNSS